LSFFSVKIIKINFLEKKLDIKLCHILQIFPRYSLYDLGECDTPIGTPFSIINTECKDEDYEVPVKEKKKSDELKDKRNVPKNKRILKEITNIVNNQIPRCILV
jgi:hypothetical protein